MKFVDKLRKKQYEEIWKEYCGFLNLSIEEYMQIQFRLMEEQLVLWSKSGLGKKILNGKVPKNVKEFREMVPLTTFSDYADILLSKQKDMLPGEPVIWIETTWEGGKHPLKLAPYTRNMLDVYKNNVLAVAILSTSTKWGEFSMRPCDKMLYGFAPLPYATGLFPLLLNEEFNFRYLPSLEDGAKMSFGERNRVGFKLGLKNGIDMFAGLSSVITYITESFCMEGSSGGSSIKSLLKLSPTMSFRLIKAKIKSKLNQEPIKPKDIFKLKSLICAGTDTAVYKDFLEEYWGIRPSEIAAGTEPTCIGTETWAKNGLILFPDACFYEFISEEDMLKNLADHSFKPSTYLINELIPNKNYEIVISVLKGGAFARYRVGDIYSCVSNGSSSDGVALPHLTYVDRVPTVIDIAGFTRITQNTISEAIRVSGLKLKDWFARKEFLNNRPYLNLYVEFFEERLETMAISTAVLAEHLNVYFKYFDNDCKDLKKLLGIEPLKITILKCGTLEEYEKITNSKIQKINAPAYILKEIDRIQQQDYFPREVKY
jgi:hypothetical protein